MDVTFLCTVRHKMVLCKANINGQIARTIPHKMVIDIEEHPIIFFLMWNLLFLSTKEAKRNEGK